MKNWERSGSCKQRCKQAWPPMPGATCRPAGGPRAVLRLLALPCLLCLLLLLSQAQHTCEHACVQRGSALALSAEEQPAAALSAICRLPL